MLKVKQLKHVTSVGMMMKKPGEKIDCPLWSWGFFDYRVAPEKQEAVIKNTEKENLER